MIHTLCIRGFRAFESLTLNDLSPVTLLVGPNNAGKSTVLEAFELLLGGGLPGSITRSLNRRNEFLFANNGDERRRVPTISHLFTGHVLKRGVTLRIEGRGDFPESIECEVVEGDADALSLKDESEQIPLFKAAQEAPTGVFLLVTTSQKKKLAYPILDDGGLDMALLRRQIPSETESLKPLLFLDTKEMINLGALWDNILLGPEEEKVVDAIRIIEPRIERVAIVSSGSYKIFSGRNRSAAEFVVKLKGVDTRLPLGSMGDGIRRLLEISICIANAAGGYLLVDEIDSGLHHSTMLNLWKMVVETARRLNVQVVATTHSADCVQALAELYEKDPETAAATCVHRIERDQEHSVRFSASEIRAAVEQEMELR